VQPHPANQLNSIPIFGLVLILAKLLNSTKASSPSGGNQTNLAARGCRSADSRRTPNVLVVTTTEGMLHGVLRNTTNLGPGVALDRVLVIRTSSLQEGLVQTPSTGNHADLGTDIGWDRLLSTGWEAEACGALVLVMGDDDSEAARSAGEGPPITDPSLDIAYNGTLGNLAQGQDVANVQSGLLTAVDKHAGVHAFGGNHELHITFEFVGVQELDLGHRGTSPRVVEDFLDHAADVTAALGVIDCTELDGSFTCPIVGLEDRGLTLSLGLDVLSHGFC